MNNNLTLDEIMDILKYEEDAKKYKERRKMNIYTYKVEYKDATGSKTKEVDVGARNKEEAEEIIKSNFNDIEAFELIDVKIKQEF